MNCNVYDRQRFVPDEPLKCIMPWSPQGGASTSGIEDITPGDLQRCTTSGSGFTAALKDLVANEWMPRTHAAYPPRVNGHAAKGQQSEFARRAARIGLGIHNTSQKLAKLAQLAKRTSMFDDPAVEINDLTGVPQHRQCLSSAHTASAACVTASARLYRALLLASLHFTDLESKMAGLRQE